jgi:hypothetical protein
MKALQVGDIARRVKREDLALALIRELIATGKALDEQAACKGTVPLANDDLVGSDLVDREWQVEETLPLLIRERADAPQLARTSKRLGASAILVRPTAS